MLHSWHLGHADLEIENDVVEIAKSVDPARKAFG